MRMQRILISALSLAMLAGTGDALAQSYGPPLQQGYAQGGWDVPPPEFQEAMRRGFHDGVEGARKDFENHRPPNVRNRDEFRNPHFIAPPDRHDYREGFRRGYAVAVSHIYGNGHRPRD